MLSQHLIRWITLLTYWLKKLVFTKRLNVHSNCKSVKSEIMKKNNSTLLKVSMFAAVTFIATLGILISCEKQEILPTSEMQSRSAATPPEILQDFPTVEICGTVMSKKLLIFQKKIVGSAFVFNDRKYLYVHAIANEAYKFHNAYLYAGMKDEVPMTSGNDPDFKAFDHKIENAGYSTFRTFKIRLDRLNGTMAIGLMLELKPQTGSEEGLIELRSWAQGYSIGVHEGQKGMLFAYKKGICLFEQPAELSDELE